MQFYEISTFDCQRFYRATLADAHKLAKCKRPYAGVVIEVVEFDHSKAGIEQLLKAIFDGGGELPQPTSRTGSGYLLSHRGGLRKVEQLPQD
jgi:hypothetical protein